MLKQLQDKPRQLSAPKASRLMWLDSSSQVVSLLHEDTLIHGVKGWDNLPFLAARCGSNALTHKLIREAALWLPVGADALGTAASFAVSP